MLDSTRLQLDSTKLGQKPVPSRKNCVGMTLDRARSDGSDSILTLWSEFYNQWYTQLFRFSSLNQSVALKL